MNNKAYSNWKKRISNLEEELESDSTNLQTACLLWNSLKGPDIYDMRSGDRLISIFRDVCLHSNEGVAKFAGKYKELMHDTGEAPLLEKFDEELLNSIKKASNILMGKDKELVEWLLADDI